ncbi:amino acid ABC transporter substrate-binding protein [Alicyclobacillus fastidiosus]|uniref:Amino acid ABC transporter substrate-binding protein n=2 Tax=Alicyclobacillus fastidiosus TaxID=392011 RepID=A0ABV5ACC7_9BACL|nr:amino acid ABC transporter substrate-binding protein [Alicyclobacillus fastidiosus]WEH11382.1 amino acid ABC transporter substrate-binding protein [Alicyclobacillus fastidiosus]
MHTKHKKWMSLSLGPIVMLAALTGCGVGNSSNAGSQNGVNGTSPGEASTQVNGQTLAQVKKSGELKIGTEGTYAPFTYHNSQEQLTGFDVELAQQVAKQLGVKADFVETPWDGMFAGLNDKRFDMIANEVGITSDRQKSFLFSNPYIRSASVVIVRANDNKIHSFKDLQGVSVAQSLTSNYAAQAKANGAKITDVQGFNEAIQLVKSGRAEATINDKLSFLQMQKQNPNMGLKIAATANDSTPCGFMFRKDEGDLQTAVNAALHTLIQNGTYDKISDKYFGTNVLK